LPATTLDASQPTNKAQNGALTKPRSNYIIEPEKPATTDYTAPVQVFLLRKPAWTFA